MKAKSYKEYFNRCCKSIFKITFFLNYLPHNYRNVFFNVFKDDNNIHLQKLYKYYLAHVRFILLNWNIIL